MGCTQRGRRRLCEEIDSAKHPVGRNRFIAPLRGQSPNHSVCGKPPIRWRNALRLLRPTYGSQALYGAHTGQAAPLVREPPLKRERAEFLVPNNGQHWCRRQAQPQTIRRIRRPHSPLEGGVKAPCGRHLERAKVMKLSRHQFLHLAAGAAALPAVSRIAWGDPLTELEILRAIQSDLASVKTDMAGVKVDVRSHTGLLDILLQDVRLLRSAVNDIARTNVTSGEIGALHHDVNRVQQGLANLEARVEVIEAGRR
jgi:hypothetical protein